MKPILVTALLLLPVAPAFAQSPTFEKPTGMRDAATHEQLAQKLRMARQNDPIRSTGKPIGKVDEDPAKAQAGRDLIKESTILSYRGNLTLVPKNAVLFMPEPLKSRLEVDQKAKVLNWQQFYQANRSWIRTIEVSREQAMGQAPMTEETVKAYQAGSLAVVATFKGGPISVLPYTPPAEETEAPADTTEGASASPVDATASDTGTNSSKVTP